MKSIHIIFLFIISVICCNTVDEPKYKSNYKADYESAKIASLSVWSQEMGMIKISTYKALSEIEVKESSNIKLDCQISPEGLYGCINHNIPIIYIEASKPEYKKAHAADHEFLHLFLKEETGDSDANHKLDWVWNEKTGLIKLIDDMRLFIE